MISLQKLTLIEEDGAMSQLESIDVNKENSIANSPEETSFKEVLSDLPVDEKTENPFEVNSEAETTEFGEKNKGHASEKKHQEHLENLLKALEAIPDPEAKLLMAIDFMEKSLGQGNTPHFKSFWHVRAICLNLFKENIQSASRATLWTKYSDLSKEARRLKELLDEQSAFAVEQIEMAIKALEADLDQISEMKEKGQNPFSGTPSKSLESHMDFYQPLQKELDLLNKQASRINALRKELIKTEMRVRKKNQFFQRLSAAGDKVFPRRKELIKEVSNKFITDVDAFIAENFSKGQLSESLYFLREEIKALQGMAKVLTLNTHAFTHTRMRLSECWDKIKHLEKDRKKARAQQKATFKDNVEAVLIKINEFNESFKSGLSFDEGNRKLDEISSYMRTIELGRDEIKYLRDQIQAARKPLLEMAKSEEQLRLEQEQERDRQKKQRIKDLKQEIESLITSSESYDVEGLTAARESLVQKIQEAPFIKSEKNELERMLKPLRDLISDKQEQAILSLSEDDLQMIQQLKNLLRQRKERRQEIKDQIEGLRKSGGSSGLGFEQAMEYNSQLTEAKESLEKSNQGIREIEKKIADLEKKVK